MTDLEAAEVLLKKPIIDCHVCHGKGIVKYFEKGRLLCRRCGGSGKKPTKDYRKAAKQLGVTVHYDQTGCG